ncbi:hypothetical protein EJ05DRAFT_487251 [Pseudovirgaria hyperparasitica]|uniref:Uncharacterized protein n=1 Tax=Pseudovirgaria hyperparasitica TaxID=470096 RepID=A0A6A6W448_9PEZI|nr:uncharacterized protein EJ05DRAFT_487251 [Pseudovirgaria hyperparasitica]KAF2756337.1 hypothetical protein EJ05DRAFT_487251 [Pseudovirgaria hyperparasitica]
MTTIGNLHDVYSGSFILLDTVIPFIRNYRNRLIGDNISKDRDISIEAFDPIRVRSLTRVVTTLTGSGLVKSVERVKGLVIRLAINRRNVTVALKHGRVSIPAYTGI